MGRLLFLTSSSSSITSWKFKTLNHSYKRVKISVLSRKKSNPIILNLKRIKSKRKKKKKILGVRELRGEGKTRKN